MMWYPDIYNPGSSLRKVYFSSEIRKEKIELKMAGGSIAEVGVNKERAMEYQGRVTPYVIIACLVAAIGGSLFGYDIGVSGNSSNFSTFHNLSISHVPKVIGGMNNLGETLYSSSLLSLSPPKPTSTRVGKKGRKASILFIPLGVDSGEKMIHRNKMITSSLFRSKIRTKKPPTKKGMADYRNTHKLWLPPSSCGRGVLLESPSKKFRCF